MAIDSKKTLLLGASENPSRYSFLAINKLREHQHPVVAIGRRSGMVSDVPVQIEMSPVPGLDTVTMYLNPKNQQSYYQDILKLHPRRVIFNPGSENPEFERLLTKNGIEVLEACTLVLLGTGQY